MPAEQNGLSVSKHVNRTPFNDPCDLSKLTLGSFVQRIAHLTLYYYSHLGVFLYCRLYFSVKHAFVLNTKYTRQQPKYPSPAQFYVQKQK